VARHCERYDEGDPSHECHRIRVRAFSRRRGFSRRGLRSSACG
jgi:hypothetical protein